MRLFIIPALIGSLALGGCTTTIKDIDDAIRANLTEACSGVETAHVAFLALTDIYSVAEDIMETELAAYGNAKNFCDHPETANTMTAVLAVIRLGGIILKATQQVEKTAT